MHNSICMFQLRVNINEVSEFLFRSQFFKKEITGNNLQKENFFFL